MDEKINHFIATVNGRKSLDRGDKIRCRVGLGFEPRSFAYVTDDKNIATQEPGENVVIHKAENVDNVRVFDEPKAGDMVKSSHDDDDGDPQHNGLVVDVDHSRRNGAYYFVRWHRNFSNWCKAFEIVPVA